MKQPTVSPGEHQAEFVRETSGLELEGVGLLNTPGSEVLDVSESRVTQRRLVLVLSLEKEVV